MSSSGDDIDRQIQADRARMAELQAKGVPGHEARWTVEKEQNAALVRENSQALQQERAKAAERIGQQRAEIEKSTDPQKEDRLYALRVQELREVNRLTPEDASRRAQAERDQAANTKAQAQSAKPEPSPAQRQLSFYEDRPRDSRHYGELKRESGGERDASRKEGGPAADRQQGRSLTFHEDRHRDEPTRSR